MKIVQLTAEESRPVLRAFPTDVPVGVRFLKRANLVRQSTAEEVETLAGEITVFRFDPISAGRSSSA